MGIVQTTSSVLLLNIIPQPEVVGWLRNPIDDIKNIVCILRKMYTSKYITLYV